MNRTYLHGVVILAAWLPSARRRHSPRTVRLGRPLSMSSNGHCAEPQLCRSYHSLCRFLVDMGRKDEAAAAAMQAKNADPTLPGGKPGPWIGSLFTRQWSLAAEQLKSAIDQDKTYWFYHVFLGRVYKQ